MIFTRCSVTVLRWLSSLLVWAVVLVLEPQPVIASVSKEEGILTVGIVTIPFRFEGPKKIDQAPRRCEEMSKHVDALLVINNERLREIYPELTVLDAFGKADDT